MTSPHAIGLSGGFGGHRIDQLLFSLALPWRGKGLGRSPLSLASGQTAPPKGEPSKGRRLPLSLLKEAFRSLGRPTCLSLWERWHGVAVPERAFPRNLSCIDRTPCREGALSPSVPRECPASGRRGPKAPSPRELSPPEAVTEGGPPKKKRNPHGFPSRRTLLLNSTLLQSPALTGPYPAPP